MKVQRQVPQSKWRLDETVDISQKFSSATKWRISVVHQRTDAARAAPESSEEEDRDSTVTACTGIDAIQDCAHDAGNDLQRARSLNQAVVRIVKETARAWRIERLQYEIREIISPASYEQAMGWKPNTANMRDLAE